MEAAQQTQRRPRADRGETQRRDAGVAPTCPTWDFNGFAFLVEAVADVTLVAVVDRLGQILESSGVPVEPVAPLSGLWDLPMGEVLPRSSWGQQDVVDGEWIVVQETGERGQDLLVVIGRGNDPEGPARAALDLVMKGAREPRSLLDDLDSMHQVESRHGATSLLSAITRAHRNFILDGDARAVFSRLLEDVLALTESEYGFIGEIEQGPDGNPMLRTWAITNIAWTEQLLDWFEENDPTGIEFTNLDTLFGAVIRTGEPVVANSPGQDGRSGGLPDGHPPLDRFLGLPFRRGDELVGMVGLANRQGGYDDQLIAELEPFLTTCSEMIEALRGRRLHDTAVKRLRTSEARTTAILESVSHAVVVTDEAGCIETFNQAAESTFGYRSNEVLGRQVSALMSDGGPEPVFVRDGEKQPSDVGRREVVGMRRDGSTFPLELSVSEVEIDGGRLLAGTCRDLTAQHQDEEKMRMFAATIEATPDFVGVARVDGKILAINGAGRAMVGIRQDAPTPDLVVGDIHAAWSREFVRDVGMPAAIANGSWAGETAFIAADGREIPMSQVILVSRDDDGEAQLVSTIARDITALKEIDRVKSEFVSTVSHELRTPLTSIRGSLGLLSGGVIGDLPPGVSEMIDLARSNTERLIRLVNDILDFEKTQAKRLEIRFEPIDPMQIARAGLQVVSGLAEEAGVTVALSPPTMAMPEISGDEDRLVQILLNLLGNAVKFSPAGGEVELGVTLGADNGSVRFTVADRGPGVDPEQLDAIFEPFHQGDSSDRRMVGGTGLGLSIAKAIAEAHGGAVSVQSELGVGSIFALELPVASITR